MSDRDDPVRGRPWTDPNGPGRHGLTPGDEQLFDWAIRFLGASLQEQGLSLPQTVAIVKESVRVYARFRKSIKDPHAFLVKQIEARTGRYTSLRDITARFAPEKTMARLLALVDTREAMATLPVKERKALEVLFIENEPLEALAAELNLSVAAAERLGRRAAARLSAWKPRDPEES